MLLQILPAEFVEFSSFIVQLPHKLSVLILAGLLFWAACRRDELINKVIIDEEDPLIRRLELSSSTRLSNASGPASPLPNFACSRSNKGRHEAMSVKLENIEGSHSVYVFHH